MIPVIQISGKRVGSTFLENCYNSHPNLKGIGEIFVTSKWRKLVKRSGFLPYIWTDNESPVDYFNEIINCYGDKTVIIKIMYNQIERWPELWNYIKKNEFSIINPYRENKLDQVISGLIKSQEKNEEGKIKTEPDIIIEKIKDQIELDNNWKNFFDKEYNGKVLHLNFNDLFGEKIDGFTYLSDKINEQICEFLNIPNQRMWSETKKENKKTIKQNFLHFERLIEKLKNEIPIDFTSTYNKG